MIIWVLFTHDPQTTVFKRGTGFEPATNGLEGRDSTIELPPRIIIILIQY
jgi:hypothetical protein